MNFLIENFFELKIFTCAFCFVIFTVREILFFSMKKTILDVFSLFFIMIDQKEEEKKNSREEKAWVRVSFFTIYFFPCRATEPPVNYRSLLPTTIEIRANIKIIPSTSLIYHSFFFSLPFLFLSYREKKIFYT